MEIHLSASKRQQHSISARSPMKVSLREDFLLFRNATRENTKQVDDTSSSDTENEMVDPKMAVKCNICEKSYPTEKKLLKHQDKKHMIVYERPKKRVSFSDHVIVHEVKEYHKCRKCPKIFKEYKSLKAHSKLHHKKRKCYICNYCNKKFVDRVFFKVHIKLHCDVCGLLFSSKLKYLQHRHKACRIQKKHQCRICNESYFRYMDLKDHSLEHLRLCYVCDVCKEQFDTKCAIAHHLKFLHSGRRPRTLYKILNIGTERLYLCRFCDESSVDKRLIEKHTQLLPDLSNRAMTGYRDFYFCDQCMRKFSTETDMLQHKWTHFLKTSDNTQVQLQSVLVNKKPKLKTTYKVNDVIPERFNPKVVLEKLAIDPFPNYMSFNCKKFDIVTGEIKKAIVDPKSKKTIVSKHQCPICGKYYSTNYCLNRHIESQHKNSENLHCHVCEETFVWPSLLRSHKCLRLNHSEHPFQNSNPEAPFHNYSEQNAFDDFNISYDDDYLNNIDFEIPAPIVELTESENVFIPNNLIDQDGGKVCISQNGYKVVVQEVPVEF
ncbi:zinc finger protein 836 isoform X2 [Bombyx mori]|uniref:zinc finger protein 836 isoform X2 n=1 Tax=Bombyx mori TaxID=7091 RepID=UPI002ED17CB7